MIQIEEMDRHKSEAIEALEISNDYVKCQKCGIAVSMLRAPTKPNSIRMDALKQIKWIEDHSHKADANIKELKVELGEKKLKPMH